MRKAAAMIVLALILGGLFWLEHERAPARTPARESCLACHNNTQSPGPGHVASAMGCSCCHLGNPMAYEAGRAHAGMVLNPGDLRAARLTCGRPDCHPDHPGRVEASVMATNQGMLASLYRLWNTPEADRVLDVRQALGPGPPRTPPLDYYAKLCATCHLWRPLPLPTGPFPERGGGCSACHVVGRRTGQEGAHPGLTARVPTDNCLRCHNRSARIGLSYRGMAEDDGYGTPHHKGGASPRALTGGRHYLHIPEDVHCRAGMACIDCHTDREVMGTGRAEAVLKDQLDIACEDCHLPLAAESPDQARQADRLAGINRKVPPPGASLPATRRSGSPLYALHVRRSVWRESPDQAVLYRKIDGAPLVFTLSSDNAPYHGLPGHERLACTACHSPAMPQCYGCHVRFNPDADQYDSLAGHPTPGRWVETRAYARLGRPALAVARSGKITPFSPCQVEVEGPAPARLMSMTSFEPHTTRTAARTCLDCHADPKAVGLGSGRLVSGLRGIRPTHVGGEWDGHVDFRGRYLSAFPLSGDRPFTSGELRTILAVGPCLPCHGRYEDPLWRDFVNGRRRLVQGRATKCAMPRGVQVDNLSYNTVFQVTERLPGFGSP